jgi:uncharacterized membrane protein YebE (DUF533 family)
MALMRAMIAAAKADGHIDDDERRKIGASCVWLGIDSEAEQFLMAENSTRRSISMTR